MRRTVVFVLHACTIWDRSVNCYVIFYAPSPDFLPRSPLASDVCAQQKAFSEITFNLVFSLLFFHTQHRIRKCSYTFVLCSCWSSQEAEPSHNHPPQRLTPSSHRKKKFVLSLGPGVVENLCAGFESDTLHEFRFSSHHPRQQISLIPVHTDVLIWRLEHWREDDGSGTC